MGLEAAWQCSLGALEIEGCQTILRLPSRPISRIQLCTSCGINSSGRPIVGCSIFWPVKFSPRSHQNWPKLAQDLYLHEPPSRNNAQYRLSSDSTVNNLLRCYSPWSGAQSAPRNSALANWAGNVLSFGTDLLLRVVQIIKEVTPMKCLKPGKVLCQSLS